MAIAELTHETRKRHSQQRWIRLGELKTAHHAQRPFLPHWANELAKGFNLENMGHLVVSHRGNAYYIIDGQHRVAALRILGFSDTDTVPCEVYEGLTERQESELFLERGHVRTIAALAAFQVAVAAGRRTESEIDTCVRAQGLHIGRTADRSISAVRALRRAHQDVGVTGLGTVLRIIRDAYGTAGFAAAVIEGIALLIQRYDGAVDEERAVKALSNAAGGLNGLLTQASKTRAALGQPKTQCIAATAATFYNRVSGGPKLAPWWKE